MDPKEMQLGKCIQNACLPKQTSQGISIQQDLNGEGCLKFETKFFDDIRQAVVRTG